MGWPVLPGNWRSTDVVDILHVKVLVDPLFLEVLVIARFHALSVYTSFDLWLGVFRELTVTVAGSSFLKIGEVLEVDRLGCTICIKENWVSCDRSGIWKTELKGTWWVVGFFVFFLGGGSHESVCLSFSFYVRNFPIVKNPAVLSVQSQQSHHKVKQSAY